VSDFLDIRIDQGVAVLCLARPGSRNSLSEALREELFDGLEAAQNNTEVGAIVLTGRGSAFCSGIDTKELAAKPELIHGIGPRHEPLFNLNKPVIGAINGPAYTGGLELALTCDWLIASERAVFADRHVAPGLTAGWGLTVHLSEAVGMRRARQMVTTGDPIDAFTALAWGLVNEVVKHEELLPRAIAHAQAVMRNDQQAVAMSLAIFSEQRRRADLALWSVEAGHWIDPTMA
jgi:enoyl-CoA hydratase